ncbi:MAG: hypothetical protein VW450_07400 [Chloroflexota bacterium]
MLPARQPLPAWVDGARWAHLAQAYRISGLPEAPMLGEALQALAATPHVWRLVAEGRSTEAQALLERFVVGFAMVQLAPRG